MERERDLSWPAVIHRRLSWGSLEFFFAHSFPTALQMICDKEGYEGEIIEPSVRA